MYTTLHKYDKKVKKVSKGKQPIKWLGLSIRLLGSLKYTWNIRSYYLENYNIQQPFGPSGATYAVLTFFLLQG